ncbi:MAG: glycosyltransferase family 2 protein [Lachnospiraceae bacterium]|nr:glycosyltransferase family 2 protein [Lachnospiraceae bacterium]
MAELLSVVVPCYNEEEALPLFIKELKRIVKDIPVDTEVVLVNDGSADGTYELMKKLAKEDSRIKYISFSRNFGKEGAIYAGLMNSSGDYVVIMDADMQDKPDLLGEMYRIIKEEGYDSVATRRVTRKGEPPVRSFFARCFYKIINKMSKTEFVDGARDYRMMNRKFVNALLQLKEYNRFSKGLFSWVGFETKWLEYENVERVAGESKWSFWSLLLYSIEGIVGFSTVPLVFSSFLGLIFCMIAFAAIIFIIVRKTVFGDPVAGWPSLVCIITLLGGLQLFTIGIVGQYMAKLYLECKDRPVYIVTDSNIENIK